MMENPQQRAYTVAEAAELLRVSHWLVREACRRGEIRSVRLGKRIIIPAAALAAFLDPAPESAEDVAS